MVSFEVQATGNLSTTIAGDITSSATPSTANETGFAELFKQGLTTIFSPYLLIFIGWFVIGVVFLYIGQDAYRKDVNQFLKWLKTRKDEKEPSTASKPEEQTQAGANRNEGFKGSVWLRWTGVIIWLLIGSVIAFNAFIQVELDFVDVIIWPVALIIILLLFRRQISGFMDRLNKIILKRGENEITFEAAAATAITGATPTGREAAVEAISVFAKGEAIDSATRRKAVETLQKALRDDAAESVKASAAAKLGLIGDPGAIPYLEEALKDNRTEVRKSVATALGELGYPAETNKGYKEEAVTALIGILKEDCAKKSGSSERVNIKVCKAAKDALKRIGDDAVDLLFDLWIMPETQANATLNQDILEILKGIGGAAFANRLGSVLLDDHSNVEIRNEAAKELAELRDPRAIEEIFYTLSRLSDPAIRSKLTNNLNDVGSTELDTLFEMWAMECVKQSKNARKDLTYLITEIVKLKVYSADSNFRTLLANIDKQNLTSDEKEDLKKIISRAIENIKEMRWKEF